MTRIVFYNHTGQISGAERMLLMTLVNLPADLFQSVLVCPENGPLRAAASALEVPVLSSREVMARFTYNPVRLLRFSLPILHTLFDLRKLFRKLSPDVIHANTVRAGIVATAATLGGGTPIVWHNHDMLPSHPLTFLIRWFAFSSRRIRIVGCSAAAAQTLRPISKRRKSPDVIYNGTELDWGMFDADKRKAKREELGLAPKEFVVGIVGQVTPRKGQLELIRAFAGVKAQIASSVLIICGKPIFNRDEEYLDLLHREVTKLGMVDCVRFLGQRVDAQKVIGALDVSVLNSTIEPFGLTLIEAMTMGTATVSTNCGGPTEIIRSGVDGEIVDVGDQNALVSAIVLLGQDPELRSRYCAAARDRVRREFSREKYIASWCKFYGEWLVSDKSAAPHLLPAKAELQMLGGGRR